MTLTAFFLEGVWSATIIWVWRISTNVKQALSSLYTSQMKLSYMPSAIKELSKTTNGFSLESVISEWDWWYQY